MKGRKDDGMQANKYLSINNQSINNKYLLNK